MLRTKSPMTRLLGKAWPGQVMIRWRLHLLGLLLSSSHTQSSLTSKPQCCLQESNDAPTPSQFAACGAGCGRTQDHTDECLYVLAWRLGQALLSGAEHPELGGMAARQELLARDTLEAADRLYGASVSMGAKMTVAQNAGGH